MKRIIAITVAALALIPLSALAQKAEVPTQEAKVVATGSDGIFVTFVVVSNTGEVKSCRMRISMGTPDCATILLGR